MAQVTLCLNRTGVGWIGGWMREGGGGGGGVGVEWAEKAEIIWLR